MKPIRILLVDDHVPTREQVQEILRRENILSVVATAGSAEEALERNRELFPDVVLMDIMLPGMSGIDATRRILVDHPQAKVIALTNHSGPVLIQAVFDAGGLGYVCKNRASEELIPTILRVSAGTNDTSGKSIG